MSLFAMTAPPGIQLAPPVRPAAPEARPPQTDGTVLKLHQATSTV